MEISKKNFLKLPEVPGIYIFWKNNTSIYIGKSVNLKSRLNSYLQTRLGPKTTQMVSEATSLTYLEVTSDLESLLLESDQIKKYKPKYNIILKDDKHALYIVITNEEFPRVLSIRKLMSDNSKPLAIFGPFPNSTNVKTILKMIRKVFPFSDHKVASGKIKKPCLYSHLGLCNPCPNTINSIEDKDRYKKNIRHIKLVLSRKFNVVRKALEREMNNFSKTQDYEEASVIREKIKTLDYITQERIDTQEFLQNPNLSDDIRKKEIDRLKNLINENSTTKPLTKLHRIECFDIAHLSGVYATASMVVLIDGEKENSEYRHFKVQQKNSQSDYDSIREIVKRRIKHLKNWGVPDLIIIDGGLGQVKIASNEFIKYNIYVVGIAKNPDRLIFANGIKIRLQKETLHIVSRIRDEAHRFARRLHHKLISKSLFT